MSVHYLYHIEDPVWQPSLCEDLRHDHGTERGEGGGFEDHTVPTHQGRRRLEYHHLERVVPGPNTPHHTQGLTPGIGETPPGELDMLACERQRERVGGTVIQ